MELLVKVIIACVIFSYVFAEDNTTEEQSTWMQHHHHSQSTEKPVTLKETKETRAEKLRKHIVECTEETKVSPDAILKLRSGKWKQALRKQPPALKRWSLCLLVKSNMMSPDGVLKQDMVLAHVPHRDRGKVENVIDKCLFRKSHPPIEIAWHYITCFRRRLLKYSII